MRNVTRTKLPSSLAANGVKWTKELLDEIARCSVSDEKVAEKYYGKYATASVKEALIEMYGDYCCYCEAQINIVDYAHIEHGKPKRQKHGVPTRPYPELTYEWTNLHLACTKCNVAKGTKYDEIDPILDPVIDSNIQQHYTYDAIKMIGVCWMPITSRGKTTANHTDLNRDGLTQARQTMWLEITNIITNIRTNPKNPSNEIVITALKKRINGPHGSMVKYLLDSLLPKNE